MGDVDHDSRVGEFPGKNTVCCGGRVVTGREWPFVVGGLIFVSILVGMFAVAELVTTNTCEYLNSFLKITFCYIDFTYTQFYKDYVYEHAWT